MAWECTSIIIMNGRRRFCKLYQPSHHSLSCDAGSCIRGGGVGREHTVYCQVPVGLGMGEAGLYNHIVHSNRRGP